MKFQRGPLWNNNKLKTNSKFQKVVELWPKKGVGKVPTSSWKRPPA